MADYGDQLRGPPLKGEEEPYIPDEIISLIHAGAKQNRDPGEFISGLIESDLIFEKDAAAAHKHFEDAPRPTDLVPLAVPPEEDPSQKKPKQTGKMWRGIGNLMRRRMFPIVQAAQQGWGALSEEQKGQVTEFLNTPMHELVGMEKSGIDYFRQMLGMGPEQGGIASLQDLREPAPVYYSAVSRAVDALPMEKGTGEQMLAMISKGKGVKPEEMQWMGLSDFLLHSKPSLPWRGSREFVTKQEVQDFVDSNRLYIGEFEDAHIEDISPEFEQYTLPGGENYRVVGLTVPRQKGNWDFIGSHLNIPNTIAHVRLNDRTGPDGEKILFLEEMQSDWHRKGRELGYKQNNAMQSFNEWVADNSSTPESPSADDKRRYESYLEFGDPVPGTTSLVTGIPDAPLKKTWYETAFRRVLRMAAEEGYDSVAWTPGEVQADRYDLSNQISEIHYVGSNFKAYDIDGVPVIERTGVTHDDLPDLIGKEAADRLLAQPSGLRSLTDEDLKIGGEKLISFYDEMMKNYANKFGKKFGARVGVKAIKTGGKLVLHHPDRSAWGEAIQRANEDGNVAVEKKLHEAFSNFDLGQRPRTVFKDLSADEIEQYFPEAIKRGGSQKVWNIPITPKMKEELLTQGIQTFAQGGFIDKPLYERTL